MTNTEASELLEATGRTIDDAIQHWDSVIADAQHAKALALQAWRDWDLNTLTELQILNARQVADVTEALLTTDERLPDPCSK